VIPAELRERLLVDGKSPGCKAFTRAHPEYVQFHQMKDAGFYADVDTPEDYIAVVAAQ
jgi:molybdenum cofactor cytidylyltransferase